MRRSLAIHCPSVRNAPGSSFGPMAISATVPMSSSSPQPMSNMEASLRRAHGAAGPSAAAIPAVRRLSAAASGSAGLARLRGSGGGRRRSGRRLMVDRLHGLSLGRLGLGLVLFREPLLERLDALGKVAHQLGDLAAPAEQQEAHRQNDNPVPDAH